MKILSCANMLIPIKNRNISLRNLQKITQSVNEERILYNKIVKKHIFVQNANIQKLNVWIV